MRIPNGAFAKDVVTGFEGRVTARVEYLSGNNQYQITAESVDNKEPTQCWIDESRVMQIEARGVVRLPVYEVDLFDGVRGDVAEAPGQ